MVKYHGILKQVNYDKIPWNTNGKPCYAIHCHTQDITKHGVPWFTMVYHGLPWYNLVYCGKSWNILIRVGADADSYVTVLLCKI